MPKRKVKNPKHATKVSAAYSGSDSEQEATPIKITKHNSSSSILCSTPQDIMSDLVADQTVMISSSEDESSIENSPTASNNSKFDSFSSLMKVLSFESDYDDEKKLFTPDENDDLSDYDGNLDEKTQYNKKLLKMQNKAYSLSEHLLEIAEQGIKIIPVPSKNLEILALQHPSSVTIHGHLKVSVLLGCASILGYEVKESKAVKVLSTESSTLVKVSTVKSTHLATIASLHKKLRRLLPKDQDCFIGEFLQQIGPATVIILVQKAILPPFLQFLEFYYPKSVQSTLITGNKTYKEKNNLCSAQETKAFTFTEDHELLANEINKMISKSISEGTEFGHRILVYGAKGSGKSSLLRYLINKALNKFPRVFYLDVDPGQTEFTPPGVVSLLKVTEPLLGPPFTHQRKPLKMVFTGSVTPAASPPMYIKSVTGLIKIFLTKFPKEVLFINTMGWIEGIGNICFKSIMKLLDPTIFVEFMPSDKLSKMKRITLNSKAISFHIPARELSKSAPLSATLRDYTLLSYFGKSQKYYMEPTYLHAFRPVSVCWDNLAIYVIGKTVPPYRLIEAIHCSVVALCHVNRELILESDKPEFPRTLVEEPLNDCLGYGVVRASDETQHLLYIVTPLSLDELKLVNAIIKGNIQLPDQVYLKQPIPDTPLPYTDSSKGVSSRKKHRRNRPTLA